MDQFFTWFGGLAFGVLCLYVFIKVVMWREDDERRSRGERTIMVSSLCEEGRMKAWVGKYEEAARCYDRAIEIAPSDKSAWRSMGYCLSSLGRNEEAVRCFDKVLELDVNDEGALTDKVEALRNLGRKKEALECCKERIRVLTEEGRLDEALSWCEEVLVWAPHSGWFIAQKSLLLEKRSARGCDCDSEEES